MNQKKQASSFIVTKWKHVASLFRMQANLTRSICAQAISTQCKSRRRRRRINDSNGWVSQASMPQLPLRSRHRPVCTTSGRHPQQVHSISLLTRSNRHPRSAVLKQASRFGVKESTIAGQSFYLNPVTRFRMTLDSSSNSFTFAYTLLISAVAYLLLVDRKSLSSELSEALYL